MAKTYLILALFISSPAALIPSSARASQPVQVTPPLSLKQVEQMIEGGIDDEVVAREISERGLAFRLPAATLEQLIKRGAGEETRRALLRQEERAAHAAFANGKEGPSERRGLGEEIFWRNPRGGE